MALIQIRQHSFLGEYVSPDSIALDIGANEGQFARALHAHLGCRVVAVEANPELAARFPVDGPIEVIQAAVASHEGRISLQVSDSNSEVSSILTPVGNHA